MDLISVIIPVYNVEKYLYQCVSSVVSQTYKNLEVILIDDGSTDSSGKICEEFAEKYKNITVIHKQNEGLGYARNTGLDNATGQYVTFIDSDDYLSDTLIDELYSELKDNQVDICISGYKCAIDGFPNVQYENICYPGEKARQELLPRMVGSLPYKKDAISMSVCGVLYNAELIRKYHLQFPSERVYGAEDLFFNIDFMQYANGGVLSSAVGYYYNINQSSITRSYQSDRFKKVKFMYQEVSKRMLELHYDETVQLRNKRILFVNVKGCIEQETNPLCNFKFTQRINHIKSICNDSTLRDAISEYPVDKLGFSQRTFLFMIKHNWAIVLYFYFSLNRIIKQHRKNENY